MARTTKLELEQINARLAQENEQLRAEVARLNAQLEAERAQPKSEIISGSSRPAARERTTYVTPQWQLDRRAQMDKLKQLALAGKKAKLVGEEIVVYG